MDTCIYMAESLCCPSETIIISLIGYTLIFFKKVKKKHFTTSSWLGTCFLSLVNCKFCFIHLRLYKFKLYFCISVSLKVLSIIERSCEINRDLALKKS